MTIESKCQQKKRLVCAIAPNMLNDTCEFKYELSGAIDDVIDAIKRLKITIDSWMPLAFNEQLIDQLTDEQESGPLPF